MYQKLEEAVDQIDYAHSSLVKRDTVNYMKILRVLEFARQNILEYIEEGYRMKEETTLGN